MPVANYGDPPIRDVATGAKRAIQAVRPASGIILIRLFNALQFYHLSRGTPGATILSAEPPVRASRAGTAPQHHSAS